MRRTTVLLAAALLLAGCGGDEPDEPDAAEPAAEQPAADADADADSNTEGNEQGSEGGEQDDEPAASDVGATVTVDGATYTADEVLDCTLGNETAPDDRSFVGENADGSVRISIAYFGEGDLAGLNGVSVDFEAGEGEATLDTTAAGGDAAFDITLRPDGADGSSEVGQIGPPGRTEDPGIRTAQFSFTC